MTESLGFRESMKKQILSLNWTKQKKLAGITSLLAKKRQFVELYKHDKNNCISIITQKVKEIDPTHENAFVKAK